MRATLTYNRSIVRPDTGGRWLLVFAVLLALCGSPATAQETATVEDVVQVATESPASALLEPLFFYMFAFATVISALAICVSRNIVRMAIWLFATLASVAMLYFLLAAYFIAAIQLIVYAGGTLVLLIFGVMLTAKSPWARMETPKRELLSAGIVCVLLGSALIWTLSITQWPEVQLAGPQPVEVLGRELLTTYLVPFEAASVLLLAVMIGAAYLARQEK